MRKWWIAVTILLILGVVVVVALANLNTLIERNRDMIIAEAEEALGRKVKVGEIGVSLWKGIGLRLTDFSLSDDASFSKEDFVRAKNLQVNLRLWPLLRGEIEAKRLVLNQPKIDIVRNRQGAFNFSTIGKKAGVKTPEKKPAPGPPAAAAAEPLALLINLVDISGGDLRYLDQKEGADFTVRKIDLRVRDFDLNRPFSIDLAAALFTDRQNFKLQTRVGPVRAGTDPGTIPLDGTFALDPINLKRLKAALPGIGAALPKGLNLEGTLGIKDMEIQGTLKDLTVNGTVDGTHAAVDLNETFSKSTGTPLVFTVAAHYGGDQLTVRPSALKLHNLQVRGQGAVSWDKETAINISLDSEPFSLAGWEKILPLVAGYQLSGNAEMQSTIRGKLAAGAQPNIQGSLTLSGVSAHPPQLPDGIKDLNATVNFTSQTADINEATFNVAGSPIKLAAEVKRFTPLVVSYHISSPQLRMSDVLLSPPEGLKDGTVKGLKSEGLVSFKNGDLSYQGLITSADGTLYNTGYKNLGAGLALDNKVARIRDFRVEALKGSVQAQGVYSMSGEAPSFSLHTNVKGLDLKDLYTVLAPKASRDIRGSLNADMNVAGNGKAWENIQPTLNGKGKTEVLNGALLNFNLAEEVFLGITGIGGLASLINPQVRQKYPETFESKDTEFKKLESSFDLAQGRMNAADLRITAADYTVLGKGYVDFNRRTDFDSVLVLSRKLSEDMAESVKELRYMFNDQGLFELPFKLTGTLPDVQPRPDREYLNRLMRRGLSRKGAEEIRRRLFGEKGMEQQEGTETTPKTEDAVEELIRKGLEGIFGR